MATAMQGGVSPLLLLLVLLTSVSDVTPTSFAAGSPEHCLEKKPGLIRLGVLPGVGWDNLRNMEGANAIRYNYERCQTTNDGRFLLPDVVRTVPIKESSIQNTGVLFKHWSKYTDATSNSINIETSGLLKRVLISGKFSREFSEVKSRMISDKTVAVRMQAKYERYAATMQPNAQLAPALKQQLLEVARHLKYNRTEHARYVAQLIVRDFGTHVVTRVKAGAHVTQTDLIRSSYLQTLQQDAVSLQVAASVSFFNIFHAGIQIGSSSQHTRQEGYQMSRTWSQIQSEGGPPLSGNLTLANWIKGVDKDLVAVDRHGTPIWLLVTSHSLPEVTSSVLHQSVQLLREAVQMYYEVNTYEGCTRLNAPNFSPAANVDDGTCDARISNLTLGGVYVTCRDIETTKAGRVCAGVSETNPKTGAFSCPSGYSSTLLKTVRQSKSTTNRECNWTGWSCWHTTYTSIGEIKGFWCSSTGKGETTENYAFGGAFSSDNDNPLTKEKSCPHFFHAYKMGRTLRVCLSDEEELARSRAIPFGGFFSCTTGNPLAGGSSQSMWPKMCPKGYSQYLGDMDEGCAIHYCVKSDSISFSGLPRIKRPPFFQPAAGPFVDDDENPEQAAVSADAVCSSGGVSPGGAAGITFVVMLLVFGLGMGAFVLWKCRRVPCKRSSKDASPGSD